ncbi:MAG: hypothetical protein GY770_02655 [Aestuariibacter sp.]|nr:hypothetical protein [Aestuariibacter sp.]
MSIAIGPTWHLDQIVFPTIGFGFDYAFPGEKDPNGYPGVYANLGIFGELITIGSVFRFEDPDTKYNRAYIGFRLGIDVSKIVYIGWDFFSN